MGGGDGWAPLRDFSLNAVNCRLPSRVYALGPNADPPRRPGDSQSKPRRGSMSFVQD
jgi:hypothetical protein